MLHKIIFCLKYYCFWLLFFILAKALFLAYLYVQTATLNVKTIFQIFWHGLRLDASFAAYLSALPFLLMSIESYAPSFYRKFLNKYTFIILLILSFLATVDIEIFRAWGIRLNLTPFLYLTSPREAAASAGNSPIVLLILLFLILFVSSLVIFNLFFAKKTTENIIKKWLPLPVFIFLTAVLIIPIRGGLQQIPINQSAAYFSEIRFANQAAINVAWNFMHALTHRSEASNPYHYFDDETAKNIVKSCYPAAVSSGNWLNTSRPNVLLIVWESATSKVIGCLGGEKGITPAFDSLSLEGILFSNYYASGDRSDKGLVSILSGFPAQPTTSIIRFPDKTAKLPHLCQDLRTNNYNTAFYYGGEPEFANIRSFLFNGGFETLISKQDFEAKDCNSKWGAHDHIVFNRMLRDLNERNITASKPFFYTLFTLSSHEPFEVPIALKGEIKGNDEQSLFLKAHHYTDHCLGEFIREAKKQAWWKNTLVVIQADHGHRLPHESANHAPEKFAIPMLWLGGAVALQDTVISAYGSQTDFAPTLLQQFHIQPKKQYAWGKNLADASQPQFAFYAFGDGMGWITPQQKTTFDNVGKTAITANPDSGNIKAAKAYLQLVFQEYLDL